MWAEVCVPTALSGKACKEIRACPLPCRLRSIAIARNTGRNLEAAISNALSKTIDVTLLWDPYPLKGSPLGKQSTNRKTNLRPNGKSCEESGLPSSMLAEVNCTNSQSRRESRDGYQQCFVENNRRKPPVRPLSLDWNSIGEAVHQSEEVSGLAAINLRSQAVQGTVVPQHLTRNKRDARSRS